jgi:hypothetical protein
MMGIFYISQSRSKWAPWVLLTACGGVKGASDGGAAAPPPGDHFFDGAATPTGSNQAPSGADFRIGVATFDPDYAANHAPGTPGSNPKIREAAGEVVTSDGQKTPLSGTWSEDGTVSLQGTGWSVQGTVRGGVITGSYQSGAGAGVFAGADVTLGQVGISFGTQGGSAFDLVVSQTGVVTGVVGGTTGGYITGTASGNDVSYSWSANGTSGSGTGSAASDGTVSGSSNSSTCPPVTWGCTVKGGAGSCDCYPSYDSADFVDAGAAACAGLNCCSYIVWDGGVDCECVNDAWLQTNESYLTPGPQGLCAVSQTQYGYAAISQCPPPPGSPIGNAPTCSGSWQTAPAPCTAISYSQGTVIHTGVAIACPGPFADLSGTCAGGNTAACTPPPGGCSCPAAGGCKRCGTVSACCLP